MTIDNTISERFPEIAKFIESLQRQYKLRIEGKGIMINSEHMSIHFKDADLQSLEDGRKVSAQAVEYHMDCGISIGTYNEFFIQLSHPDYLFLDTSAWPGNRPLKFMIGNMTVIVGMATPLIVLLTEPVFRDSDYYPEGFSELASIQLLGPYHKEAQHALSKALYYLNSHYLRPTGLFAKLHKVVVDFDDPLGLTSGEKDFDKMFDRVLRIRIRKRTDYTTIEPLILYNHAAQSSNIEQFMGFYRVLEFFMNRNAVATIERMRHDASISSSDILKFSSGRNEETLLTQLVQNVLTASQKNRLTTYAHDNGLMKKDTALAKALYAFRNSVIHAKEPELARIMVPDPFEESKDVEGWTYIVRFIAERSIRKLNT